MTLLLAALVGMVWLTLSSQPATPPSLAAAVNGESSQIQNQNSQPVVSAVDQTLATPTLTLEPATEVAPVIDIPQPSDTPTVKPTATDPPLPTNTPTARPTPTPTITPTSSPTPLSLPLPTPPKTVRLDSGWQVVDDQAGVRSLTIDKNGFLWQASSDGVLQQSTADPAIRWIFSTNELGLGGNGVSAIFGDSQGGVWAGGNGVVYFNGLLWRSFSAADGLAAGQVQVIAEDTQGRIWIGTQTGLSIWNGASFFTLNKQFGLPNDDIVALLSDGPRMWIGTNGGGLFRFENNQLQVFNVGNIGMLSDVVSMLGKLPDGTLLIGTDKGLMSFDGSKSTPIEDVPRNRVTAILNTILLDVWVGTDGGGLHHLVNGRWSRLMDNANLPDPRIATLVMDGYGSLWIATNDGRLSRFVGTAR